MTPEQTEELAALKAALKQHIEEAEKVPSKKWKTSFRPKGLFIQNANPHDVGVPNDVCRIYNCACSNEFATFMVQARTMSPLACRIALEAIKALEEIVAEDKDQLMAADHDLIFILDLWKGGKA